MWQCEKNQRNGLTGQWKVEQGAAPFKTVKKKGVGDGRRGVVAQEKENGRKKGKGVTGGEKRHWLQPGD